MNDVPGGAGAVRGRARESVCQLSFASAARALCAAEMAAVVRVSVPYPVELGSGASLQSNIVWLFYGEWLSRTPFSFFFSLPLVTGDGNGSRVTAGVGEFCVRAEETAKQRTTACTAAGARSDGRSM